jgi:hypothetical protein
MRESLMYGSVRGARSNSRPYRDVLFAALRESGSGIVSRVTPVHTAVRNFTRDEGGPFEFGNQVPMHRLGADCFVVVRHRLCRPTANETLVSHYRVVGIELRRRVCFFVALKRSAFARWHEPYDARVAFSLGITV